MELLAVPPVIHSLPTLFPLTRTVFPLHFQDINPNLFFKPCMDDRRPFPNAQRKKFSRYFDNPCSEPHGLFSVHLIRVDTHLFFSKLNVLWWQRPHLLHLYKPTCTMGMFARGKCSYFLIKYVRRMLYCAKAHCVWSFKSNGQVHVLRWAVLKKDFSEKDI